MEYVYTNLEIYGDEQFADEARKTPVVFAVATSTPACCDVTPGDDGASDSIAAALCRETKGALSADKYVPFFMHVGASTSTGDSVGPFVGWFLKRKGFTGLYLGDLDNPVHAVNLKEKLDEVWMMTMKANKFPYIIAVDAAVSGRPGRITVNSGPLKPGSGMGKTLPHVGSVHIMAGMAQFPFMIWFAGLDKTVAIAETIADALLKFHSAWESGFARTAVAASAK